MFSTKFLEDLDYQAQYIPPKSTKVYKKPDIYNLEAEKKIQLIKQEVNNNITSQSQGHTKPRNILHEAIFNGVTIDIAESIFNEDIEQLIKEIVSKSLSEELNKAAAFEKPTYDKIYEEVTKQMYRDIANEVLTEGKTNAKNVDNNEIKKVAKEEIVSNLMLDHMLDKMAQHGRVSGENEDISKVLDGLVI